MRPLPTGIASWRSKGFALITALLFLMIIAIWCVVMMRNMGLQGKMAGGFREKGRSFEAAQSALIYAEWWLAQGNGSSGSSCSSVVTSPVVCSNALSSPASLPWTVGVSYTPPGMSIASSGLSMFASSPMFYIQYVGVSSTTGYSIYRISAVGYGGNSQAVTVLQSTYAMSTSGNVQNVGQ
ncbi:MULTISPECIES: PilX N-terminal domain-containing pilus assembly protein [Aquitalea]|uniref:pilus assembly PilX family protein n=1 Tax=Aquitalea TaxID=407217 RepID=UPI001358C252|nr:MULTISPECIES: PilX N-terminal domain-containing pilus assembly protein [Aquitalea]